ncbi:MAG: DUF1997 domain-containing protein [Leptolyngbyaceae cyanobacterium bins.349]|nr:DUF1997 domain-containing protein [Leptolyngbyaceae cyanobacterium bins.349]
MDTRFLASQSVDIPVVEQPVPIHHYLRQPHRLVNALTTANRIETLGNDLFRLKMRPLTFMTLSLQPIVDLRVWADPNGTVHLRSVRCEMRGMDYINDRFTLDLVGKLYPHSVGGTTHLQGRADLEVRVDLPPPFLFTPKSILETTGNGLLKSVLLTVKQRLMHQLVSDYQTWAMGQNFDEVEATIGSNQVAINP